MVPIFKYKYVSSSLPFHVCYKVKNIFKADVLQLSTLEDHICEIIAAVGLITKVFCLSSLLLMLSVIPLLLVMVSFWMYPLHIWPLNILTSGARCLNSPSCCRSITCHATGGKTILVKIPSLFLFNDCKIVNAIRNDLEFERGRVI